MGHAVEGQGSGCGGSHVLLFGLGPMWLNWAILARLWLARPPKWFCTGP